MRFATVFVALASLTGVLAGPLPMPAMVARNGASEFRARPRANAVPVVVSNLVCDDSGDTLVSHDVNVAQLQICGSIAGTIQKCEGNPTSTTGVSGTASFSIEPVNAGDTINVSKGRWEQHIKAAFKECGQDVPFTATFRAGASTGDINVSLTRTGSTATKANAAKTAASSDSCSLKKRRYAPRRFHGVEARDM
ncbi:hypothetical protein BD626DRAFT_582710 [Schizophyllum amplum]|uniref:Uncharacterized protein n=1 Tax=Schizophyllum amplum TaxID=97359 RepID=A0A550CJE9_9AGAR|nr:hypothetical protein BD626DRAFT_582710 [Auriculariopsis ampla]